MSNGQADFFRNMLPYARRVSELTGIDPRLVLAQSALETGYGRSAPNFNFFGIKAPQGQGASLMTSEFENGRMVSRSEPFRTYDSPAGSFEDYASLMLRAPRYRPVLEARTLEDQIAAMARSGYATDPEYGNKLSQIASRINLDDPGLIASDAMTAIGRGPDTSGMTAADRPRPAMNGQPTQLGLLAQGPAQQRPRRDIGNILDQLAIGFSGMSLRPNQAIVQMAQQRIGQRQEQQQTQRERNATAEWIRSQGRADLAEGIMNGAITAAQAMQIIQQQGQRRAPIEVDGRLVDPETFQVLYEAPQGAGTAESFNQLNVLRDDLRNELSSFEIVRQGYNNITSFYNNPNATSDYALAVAFAKILDPGSVAREGEVAAVQNAGARVPALGQALRNAITGEGSLTPQVRQQIAELANQIYGERSTSAQQTVQRYSDIATRYGLPTDLLFTGEIPPPTAVIPAVVPPNVARLGVTQEDWDRMTIDERRTFLEDQNG
jgi:hypothetical protein